MFQPFKITFTFLTPVVIDNEYPMHLDALIAWAVMKEASIMGYENAWATADDLSAYLERTQGENEWVWKASQLQFQPASEHLTFSMIRRSDGVDYFKDFNTYWEQKRTINPATFKIDSRSGLRRAYQWIAVAKWMKQATAYGIGDIEAVRHALSLVKFIGKYSRNGYGRIRSIEIAPDAQPVESWRLRALPEDEPGLAGYDYIRVRTPLRAPYWKKSSAELCLAKTPLL